jgi:soluble lytic murein transglycosylase
MILRHFLKYCLASGLAMACVMTAHAQTQAQARKPAARPAAAAAPTTPDEAFLAAHAAFRAGDRERLARSAPLLEGHILEQYIDYWRLKQRQEELTPTEIRGFLAKYPGSYLAERMRTDWLRELGRRGDWETFDLEVAPLTRDDLEVRCYMLLSRLARKDVTAYDEAKELWSEPRDLPEGCGRLSDQLVERGKFSVRQVWQRARMLLGAGHVSAARATLAYLPAGEKVDDNLLNLAATTPQKLLANLPEDLKSRATREVVMFAVIRQARNEPRPAAELMKRSLNERLPAADRKYVWGYLAYEAARRLYPDANEWYAQAADAELTDEQLAWKVRAALRTTDWRSVRSAIDSMSVAAHKDAAWSYWYGRALAAERNLEGARAYYLRISTQPNFYGVLAAEALGESMYLPKTTHEATDADIARLRNNPGVARMIALYRLNLRLEGIREWIHAVRDMDDRTLIAAAELARRSDFHDRAINTADRTEKVHNFRLRYLAPFRESFKEHVQAFGLEEAWVLGVVRQESRFIVEARSPAGARGLMQLMPTTARWVARQLGMKDFTPAKVTQIDTNIVLGTRYLKYVLDDLGHPVLATAAYNAGPGRARRWRDVKPLEGAIYVESIPFSETRDYVKKVMSNAMYYTAVLEGKPVPLKERLGVIAAKSANERFNEELP